MTVNSVVPDAVAVWILKWPIQSYLLKKFSLAHPIKDGRVRYFSCLFLPQKQSAYLILPMRRE